MHSCEAYKAYIQFRRFIGLIGKYVLENSIVSRSFFSPPHLAMFFFLNEKTKNFLNE